MTDEQRQRIHDIEYSCDGRTELAERIVALEDGYGSMSREHSQLVVEHSDALYEIDKLNADNAKLVSVLHEVEDDAILAFNSLREDCETITASSQHFFDKWWHAECEADRLKTENVKLREQIHWLKKGDILHVLTDQELADQQKHEREVQASITALDDENVKLRELVRKSWFIVLSQRDALRTHGVNPDGGTYIRELDETIAGVEVAMRELGIEVDA